MISRRRFLALGAAGAATGVVGTAADAFAIEPGFRLAVSEWSVAHRHWPAQEAPLRIGIMTDIHAVEPWMSAGRVHEIATRLAALKPDIIVLLGDYVKALPPEFYSRTVPVADWVDALKPLSAPLGVYAVLGNHDWWSGQVPAIRHALQKTQIHLLENRSIKITRGTTQFWIAGLGDQLAFGGHGADDLAHTLGQVTSRAPVILLAHEPDIFPEVPQSVTLTLCGHTHGGQVYIPFVGRPALHTSYFGRYANYAYGHVVEDGKHMVVSSGLGLSNFPVRFMVPPEIAIVTLVSESAAKRTPTTTVSNIPILG